MQNLQGSNSRHRHPSWLEAYSRQPFMTFMLALRSTLRFEFRNKICSKVLSKACTHANSTHGNPRSYYRLQHTLFYILQTKVNGLSCPTFHSILILTIFFALPSELFPVSKFDANPLALLCCSKNESGHTLFLFTSPTLKSTLFN